MKIVILDGYTLNPGDLSWEGFEQLGEVVCYDRTDAKDIIARIGDAGAVITNKTPLTEEIFNSCPSIKYVGVLATGYNVVDIEAAKERGIVVTNIPTYGTAAVSQFVFALLLEICHHVQEHSKAVYDGAWEKGRDFCFWKFPLVELAGKTMGIVGFGRIGQQTARIAQGFNMKVLAYDAFPDLSLENADLKYADLETLYAQSDVISLHCPLFAATEGMINADSIAKMKDGVIIINTSRGPLINEDDLAQALKMGTVGAAAVDVVSSEPIKGDNPLLAAPNCFITPHIAWAPLEARARLLGTAVDNMASFLNGEVVNQVNSWTDR